jgi:hypothetical protein
LKEDAFAERARGGGNADRFWRRIGNGSLRCLAGSEKKARDIIDHDDESGIDTAGYRAMVQLIRADHSSLIVGAVRVPGIEKSRQVFIGFPDVIQTIQF